MYIERRRAYAEDFNIQEDRRYYSADFKAQVALAAIKDDKPLRELAVEFAIHPNQIALWKQHLLNNITLVFDKSGNNEENVTKMNKTSHAKIGQIMAENDFLTKILGR
jgi:transposase-like protein